MLPTSESLSTILGYLSIGSWLGAQFPQLVENAKLQSVEHLALPFLANWLFGDITNLVGCVLTHQLPFQTWVATYFCFIDICLVVQFIYYSRPRFKINHAQPSPILPVSTSVPSRHRTFSELSSRQGTMGSTRRSPSQIPHHVPHLRKLSTAAVNVAVAASSQLKACLTAEREFTSCPISPDEAENAVPGLMERSWFSVEDENRQLFNQSDRRNVSWGPEPGRNYRSRSRSNQNGDPVYSRNLPSHSSVSLLNSSSLETSIEPGGGPERGRALTRPALVRVPTNASFTTSDSRHVLVARGAANAANIEDGILNSLPPTVRQKSAGASRRGAGIVFLGMWVLFSLGNGRLRSTEITSSGSVLGSVISYASQGPYNSNLNEPWIGRTGLPHPLFSGWSSLRTAYRSEPPPQSTEHIIGRISAWTCTTLYLTSRLPQIWKNFTRKSVEGLTMSLFICAFFGNLFYVASIMTNPLLEEPAPVSTEYIRESIPYLLGSGGTLIFDITIVSQSFKYRGRHPLRSPSVIASPRSLPNVVNASVQRHGVRQRSLSGAGEGEPLLQSVHEDVETYEEDRDNVVQRIEDMKTRYGSVGSRSGRGRRKSVSGNASVSPGVMARTTSSTGGDHGIVVGDVYPSERTHKT